MKLHVKKERRARVILYVLALYSLFQICWWGTHIIQLKASNANETDLSKVYGMVFGEGGVFVLIMLGGFFYIHRTIRREFKMARIQSAFMLSITHELKTPVAAIRLGIDTLKNRKLNESQTEEMLLRISKEALRLQNVSENIILAAKLDARDSEPMQDVVDLQPLFQSINRVQFNQVGQIQFRVNGDVTTTGDENLLRALYINLVENALKYSPQGGNVRVLVEARDRQVFLVVSDDGPGIPLEEREQVKQKFYRMGDENTRRHQGTGLGLFIVDQIVRLHRANWSIGDTPEGGCQITVAFQNVNM
jgi:signal transduction histidine kinase